MIKWGKWSKIMNFWIIWIQFIRALINVIFTLVKSTEQKHIKISRGPIASIL